MNVTLQYYKYPRTLHWRHDMVRLGEDEHGVWLGASVGSMFRKGTEPELPLNRPIVQLVTPDRWWCPIFNGGDHPVTTYIDIASLPEWPSPDRVELIDLDLDVLLLSDGTIRIDDEDEFDEHQVSLGYPPRLVSGARSAVAQVVTAIEAARPPFDGRAEEWLGLVS